jgi:hypothetical protein
VHQVELRCAHLSQDGVLRAEIKAADDVVLLAVMAFAGTIIPLTEIKCTNSNTLLDTSWS